MLKMKVFISGNDMLEKNSIIFAISLEDLQYEANEKIGRILTEEEIQLAIKGLESGLLTGIDNIYRTIFYEMINNGTS